MHNGIEVPHLGWYRECDLRLDSGRVDLSFLAKEWKPELVETLKMDGVLKFGHLSGEVRSLDEFCMSRIALSCSFFRLKIH